MATLIPYHPSLTLGSIVKPDIIQILNSINKSSQEIIHAEDKLNGLIATYHSLDLTTREIKNLDPEHDFSQFDKNSKDILKSIESAALNLTQVKLDNEKKIEDLKQSINYDTNSIESPLNYKQSLLTHLPLAADSLKLDCQYFSSQSSEQKSGAIDSIKSFVQSSTQNIGQEAAKEAAHNVSAQVQSQHNNHDVIGTIIITATCTHKNVSIFDPCILDTNKATSCWNNLFKDDIIDINQLIKSKGKINQRQSSNRMSLISGATYGSCFIGMIHMVRKNTISNEKGLNALASSVQEQIELGKWMANAIGKFGLDPSFEKNIKDALSVQSLDTHLNIVIMGAIPSIQSSNIEIGLNKFIDIAPEKIIKSADKKSISTVTSDSQDNKEGAQKISVYNSITENLLLNLNQIDKQANNVLDMNTMMTAFSDYIKKITTVSDKATGIPINYYIKEIDKSALINLCLKKYIEDKSNISELDSSDDKK